MRHITADDAEMVDIIHTDAGAYGAPVRTGSIDFWPNGGTAKQPGCPRFTFVPLSDDGNNYILFLFKYCNRLVMKILNVLDLCSHWRSWRFYAESVRFPEAFPAVPAKSYKDFKKEFTPNNKSNDIVFMGYKTSPRYIIIKFEIGISNIIYF